MDSVDDEDGEGGGEGDDGVVRVMVDGDGEGTSTADDHVYRKMATIVMVMTRLTLATVSVLRVIQKCMQNGTRYTVLKPKVGKAPMGMDGWWWCFYYRNPNPDVCRSNTRNFLKS